MNKVWTYVFILEIEKAITIYILAFQILHRQEVSLNSKYRIKKKRIKITRSSKLVMPNLSFSVQYFEIFLFLDSFSQSHGVG